MAPYSSFLPFISPEQWQQLRRYEALLLEWNQKINLIARTDPRHTFEKHILPVLPASSYWETQPIRTVLDIGTGGGIPGIPLAIVFPAIQFTLIDATRKKIQAVAAIAHSLGLKNVRVKWTRSESFPIKCDACVGRGVMPLVDFIALAKPHLNKNGTLFYWSGGDLWDSIPQKLKAQTDFLDLETFFNHQYALTKKIFRYRTW